MIIAIDGPAGSGKSTVAKALALRLNFLYLDTGAMYRALTLKVIKDNIDLEDKYRIIVEAKNLGIEFKQDKVYLDSEEITSQIRDPLIDRSISKIAKIAGVRKEMVEVQRRIARSADCVIEGRDTTTVVFPDAELKIFLDADSEERVQRRYLDFKKKNLSVDMDILRGDLKKRDEADISRDVGPLRQAADSICLDTTSLSIDEVVERIYSLAVERGLETGHRPQATD